MTDLTRADKGSVAELKDEGVTDIIKSKYDLYNYNDIVLQLMLIITLHIHVGYT